RGLDARTAVRGCTRYALASEGDRQLRMRGLSSPMARSDGLRAHLMVKYHRCPQAGQVSGARRVTAASDAVGPENTGMNIFSGGRASLARLGDTCPLRRRRLGAPVRREHRV